MFYKFLKPLVAIAVVFAAERSLAMDEAAAIEKQRQRCYRLLDSAQSDSEYKDLCKASKSADEASKWGLLQDITSVFAFGGGGVTLSTAYTAYSEYASKIVTKPNLKTTVGIFAFSAFCLIANNFTTRFHSEAKEKKLEYDKKVSSLVLDFINGPEKFTTYTSLVEGWINSYYKEAPAHRKATTPSTELLIENGILLSGPIRDKYLEIQKRHPKLGCKPRKSIQISEGHVVELGDKITDFAIYHKTGTPEAFEVHGGIRNYYESFSGPLGHLGFPTSDEEDYGSNGDKYNNFEHKKLIWKKSEDRTKEYPVDSKVDE